MYLTDHNVNQRYAKYIQPLNQDVFGLLDDRLSQIDADWYNRTILDYGCNIGNLLITSGGKIKDENYIGLDVIAEPLEIAKNSYPAATWIYYNGYHSCFNPTGTEYCMPAVVQPDVIVCHGVFTHCDMDTIISKIAHFRKIIATGGVIVFSAWEREHFPKYTQIFLPKQLGITLPSSANLEFKESLYLIDRSLSIVDQYTLGDIGPHTWIETFFDRDYILKNIPDARVLPGRKTKHTVFTIQT
jgi:2-polyprenyl-3-methyl-5-hydroxy-6-metoxy-1,4-benzoquinol methylase